MKKLRVILLIALLVMIIGVAVAVWYVDANYEVVWSAPHIAHETILPPNTAVRVLILPFVAPEFFKNRMNPNQKAPDWLFDRVFPYEVTIMIAPDAYKQQTGVTIFINEQRLGPVIAEAVNKASPAKLAPQVNWAPTGMVHPKRGVLLLDGTVPMDPETESAVREQWPGTETLAPLPMERTHLVEAIFDNRQGRTYALFSSLVASANLGNDTFIADLIVGTLKSVTKAKAYADQLDEDTMQIDVTVECDPFASGDPASAMEFLLDTAAQLIGQTLESRHGLILEGASGKFDLNVEGHYTISGFSKLPHQPLITSDQSLTTSH